MGWFSDLTSSIVKPINRVTGSVATNVLAPAIQSFNPALEQLGMSLGLGLGSMNASSDKTYWDNYLKQNQIDQLKNQMTAMKQAGLNPNLMYGNMGSGALNGASGGGSAGATGFFDALNMAAKMVANGSTAMYNAFVKSGAKQGMKNLLKKDKAVADLVQGQAKAQTIKNIKEVNKVVKGATGKGDNLLKGDGQRKNEIIYRDNRGKLKVDLSNALKGFGNFMNKAVVPFFKARRNSAIFQKQRVYDKSSGMWLDPKTGDLSKNRYGR